MKTYVFEYETDLGNYYKPIVVSANTYAKAISLAKTFVSTDCYKAFWTSGYRVYSSGRVFNRMHKNRFIFCNVLL